MKYKTSIVAAMTAVMLSQAAYSQDFEVSPCNLNFNALPGTLQSREIVITNHSSNAAMFQVRLEDYDIDEDGNRHVRQRGSVPYSCNNWVSVSPTLLGIDPNSQGVVVVTMSVPNEARESRWGQLVVSESHERTSLFADNSNGAGVILSPEIVVDLVQTPNGFSDSRAALSSFVELEPMEDGTRIFNVTVTNQGHGIVSGQLYVVAANLQHLLESEIMKRQVRVLPGSSLKLRLALEPGLLPNGEYDFTCLFDMGPSLPLKGVRFKENVIINR